MNVVKVARIVLGAIGIGGPGIFLVVVTLISPTWWMIVPCVIFVLVLMQEWRYFIHAETGRAFRGVMLKPTAWWNFVGYYVLLGFCFFVFLGQSVWHLSDIKMLIGVVIFVIALFTWVTVRIQKMPKLPRPTLPRLFQR